MTGLCLLLLLMYSTVMVKSFSHVTLFHLGCYFYFLELNFVWSTFDINIVVLSFVGKASWFPSLIKLSFYLVIT